jgi:hypothetical protein
VTPFPIRVAWEMLTSMRVRFLVLLTAGALALGVAPAASQSPSPGRVR